MTLQLYSIAALAMYFVTLAALLEDHMQKKNWWSTKALVFLPVLFAATWPLIALWVISEVFSDRDY